MRSWLDFQAPNFFFGCQNSKLHSKEEGKEAWAEHESGPFPVLRGVAFELKTFPEAKATFWLWKADRCLFGSSVGQFRHGVAWLGSSRDLVCCCLYLAFCVLKRQETRNATRYAWQDDNEAPRSTSPHLNGKEMEKLCKNSFPVYAYNNAIQRSNEMWEKQV